MRKSQGANAYYIFQLEKQLIEIQITITFIIM